jgi:hypothetical protein
MKEEKSLVAQNEDEKDERHSFFLAVSMPVDDFYEIQDGSNQKLLRSPVTPSEPKEDAIQLLETWRHLAEYELVRGLTNNTSEEQSLAFRQSYSVHVIDTVDRRINPGCLQ